MVIQNNRKLVIYRGFAREEADFFSKHFLKTTFPMKTDFFYEGQIPNAAIYLIKGEISLEKYDRVVEHVHQGALIGVRELINNTRSKFKVVIWPQSEILILDKTTLGELFNSPSEFLEKFSIH